MSIVKADYKKIVLNVLLFTFLIFFCNSGCLLDDTEKYIEDLESGNIMVKINATYQLGEKKERRAVPKLIKLLTNNPQKEIKLCIIEALGEIGENNSVEVLIEMLTETDKEIQIAAVVALGKIKDSQAVTPLLDVMTDKDIQLYAIAALGNIGDKKAVPALTKLLINKNKYVRYNSMMALKKIK